MRTLEQARSPSPCGGLELPSNMLARVPWHQFVGVACATQNMSGDMLLTVRPELSTDAAKAEAWGKMASA